MAFFSNSSIDRLLMHVWVRLTDVSPPTRPATNLKCSYTTWHGKATLIECLAKKPSKCLTGTLRFSQVKCPNSYLNRPFSPSRSLLANLPADLLVVYILKPMRQSPGAACSFPALPDYRESAHLFQSCQIQQHLPKFQFNSSCSAKPHFPEVNTAV